MTMSSIPIESTNFCNDWIGTRIDTADSSVSKNAANTYKPMSNNFLEDNGCLGRVSLRKEPLKIGLYSDDSSISSCETDNDDSENDVASFQKSCDSCDRFIVTAAATRSAVKKTNIPCISPVPRFKRKLGVDHLCNSVSISLKRKRRSAPRYDSKGNKRSVSIDKSVSVVPIPSRTEYSCQVRERIWSSSEELFANAARNSVEFASEGWNWRQAVEDEEMIVHKPSGELIHPIHLHNALACINHEEKTDNASNAQNGK